MTIRRVIDKASHATVAETVARPIAEVEARGVKLFTTIDHSGEARSAGLELCETKLVVSGNPRTGTPIMQAAGLDLPLKALVRADAGRTCVSDTAQAELAPRYELSDELAAGVAGIDVLTDAAVGRSGLMPRLSRTRVRNEARRRKLVALRRRNRRGHRPARRKG